MKPRRKLADLETVDLVGVEILASGGPVFGVGSPPEGDFWTPEDLRAMAEADSELGDEIRPPAKLGHSDAQQLVLNSADDLGLAVTPGEMPAVGWLENLRLNSDGTKLLADVKGVPKKLGDLIEAGAYRTRSVELAKVTSQSTGKVYEWVVTGLAWLGAKLPAVRTLDDVVALYEADGVEIRRAYATGDLIWEPGDGLQSLRERVSEALNGAGGAGMIEPRFYVRDIADGRALVEDWYDESKAWVVPFTLTADGRVAISPSSEWTEAEQAWVEAAKAYEQAGSNRIPGSSRGAADTGAMKFTDEQKRTFAEATGVDPEKVTDEMLEKAGVKAADEPEARDLESDDRIRSLEARVEESDTRSKKLEQELHDERKRNFVEALLSDGQIEPGQREKWERTYELNPEHARSLAEDLKPNEDLAREYGAEGGETEDEQTAVERAYEADLAARMRVTTEELI